MASRTLRGSDFLMRWSQGQWTEHRLLAALNDTSEFRAIPYGPSGTAPDKDITAYNLYFERLEAAGLGLEKRPDLLVFDAASADEVFHIVAQLGGETELPFTPEDDPLMQKLLSLAVAGIECENSLWVASMMKDYGKPLRPQKRLGGRYGLSKSAVVPTIIIKEEDRKPLLAWQKTTKVPIHLWHAFYDRAYGLSLDEIEKLIAQGLIEPTVQTFTASSGATTTKTIYKIYYHYAYEVGRAVQEPDLVAKSITDTNGRIMPYVYFDGGKLELLPQALDALRTRPHSS